MCWCSQIMGKKQKKSWVRCCFRNEKNMKPTDRRNENAKKYKIQFHPSFGLACVPEGQQKEGPIANGIVLSPTAKFSSHPTAFFLLTNDMLSPLINGLPSHLANDKSSAHERHSFSSHYFWSPTLSFSCRHRQINSTRQRQQFFLPTAYLFLLALGQQH